MTLPMLLLVTLATVRGQVSIDGDVLPGCTVRLESATLTRMAVSNADGRYRFDGVVFGEYELFFELEGLRPAQQCVLVREESVTVPTQELKMTEVPEVITVECHRPCTEKAPDDRFGRPRCSDYEMNTVLIASAEQGDASSVQLLRNRYETADTYSERHRIAGVLLRKIPDAKIWDELVAHAEVVLRFHDSHTEPSQEYLQWCANLNVDPARYWFMAYGALRAAGNDSRSRSLLRSALATANYTLHVAAIEGLAHQRDFESLPLIAEAIASAACGREVLAGLLESFHDERADAIARKYLPASSQSPRTSHSRE